MRKMSRWIPIIGGAIAGGIIALVIASNSNSTRSVTTTVVQPSSSSEPTSFSSGGGMSINQIYKSAAPGVVDIVVTAKSSGSSTGNLFGGGGGQITQGEGAGVVYNRSGDILTDEHVVAGATKVVVTFQDGKQVAAKVLGTDPSTDVGVIKVNVPSSELHPIALADSSAAQVGDPVVAIGSPFSLPETVTSGIVSQTGRPIKAPNGYTIPGSIQTDAPINPGNSGGPLLNANAQVLGLNDQIETNNTNSATGQGSSSGIGFATPGNSVKRVADEIIAGKKVQHAYLGVCLQPSTTGDAQIATGPSQGCPNPVSPNTPAGHSGLQPGDTITAIDAQAVSSTNGFIATLDKYNPGQTVTLTVKRNGQTKHVSVKLGERPASAPSGG